MPRKKAETSLKGLAITKSEKQVLSKQQKTFNRLVKKVENLQNEIASTRQMLDKNLDDYVKKLHPEEKKIAQLRMQCVKLLYPFITDKKKLTARQQETLKDMIAEQLGEIARLTKEPLSPEMEEVFEAVTGQTMQEATQETMDEMKSEMEDMFAAMGFKINLNDLDLNMAPEEMAAKLFGMKEEMEQQAEEMKNRRATRKKTKKQLEKEEREKEAEKLKSKSISRIYKQLAKVLHPDLEQDAGQKVRKEQLMKDLTRAYKNNDLHTLLRFELEWIQQQEADLDQLTEEKLAIYNQLLKEQITELEMEADMQVQHPRYEPLHYLVPMPQMLRFFSFKEEQERLVQLQQYIADSNQKLQGPDALKEVKLMVKQYNASYLN